MKGLPVMLGAPVEYYPSKAWSRLPKDVDIHQLWALCGPQVEKHIQNQPLWKVFCLVYFEGLAHGSGIARKEQS